MGIQFRDANAPRYNGGRPSKPEELPHGLVSPPQEILDLVAEEAAQTPLIDEAYRRRLTECYTLEYYYEGWDVAYRRTPEGIEVFAVGLEEVEAYVRNTPPEQRQGVVFGQG